MSVDLNTPPVLPPQFPPAFSGPETSSGDQTTVEDAAAKLAAIGNAMPVIDPTPDTLVELPGGLILDGRLIQFAQVRELNGYDEERLSRLDMQKNVATYVTELLSIGVVELGGSQPSREMLRGLLVGDRDELLLGVRRATYGTEIEYKLSCNVCGEDSDVVVDIDEDIPRQKMEDPLTRVFDVPLRHDGTARVGLITGMTQEAFSENIGRKTQSEINTVMLSKSVLEINGVPTLGQEEQVRKLSAGDRQTIQKFLDDHRPGPQFNAIDVPCATCGEKYPIFVGLPNLFRF